MDPTETEKLDAFLKKYFNNPSCKGYTAVDGVTMPLRFQEMRQEILDWNVNEEDVWICSFPRSGTTWTQEMVWMIMNNLDFEEGKKDLFVRSPFLEFSALFDFSEIPVDDEYELWATDSLKFLKTQKSPLCIKTHLPVNLLPRDIQTGKKKPKIIYVSRNPKDTCVSYYHHCKFLGGYIGDFDDFCKLFLAGKLSYAPYWNHVIQYINLRHRENLLLLTYEEMKKDLPSVIRKTANFLEKPLSEGQVDVLTKHLSFESMKQNPSVNSKANKGNVEKFELLKTEGEMIRSGLVGGYKEVMTPEMVEEFDRWIEENTKNTGFDKSSFSF